jgi:glycosyltransferase involved in cell wall biosynthesis
VSIAGNGPSSAPSGRRRILLVAYYAPDVPGPGGHRWSAMSAYLEELGYEVVVLGTSAFGSEPTARETVRARDLVGSPVLRRLLRRPPLRSTGAAPVPSRASNRTLSSLLVPDVQVAGWAPFAAMSLRRLIARQKIDCIVTSGPPHSVHLLPLILGRGSPPWVIDLRDGWTFERPGTPVWPLKSVDAWLEQRALRAAARVTAVTEAIAADIVTRLDVPVMVAPNGWDPALERDVARATGPEASPDRFTLVHTGSLSGQPGRDPGALFEGLREAAGSRSTASALELVLAGRPHADEAERIARAGLNGIVRHVGYLERPAAVALQRQADALILLAGTGLPATGKLAEYLASGRPIIVLGSRSEAARIVRRTRTGTSVPADDPVAIAQVLRQAAAGELARDYAPRDLERYRYPAPAQTLAEAIEQAIGSPRRDRTPSRAPAYSST